MAAQARAAVRDGTPATAIHESQDAVQVRTADGQTLTARYLVGADGATSVVARSLGLRSRRRLGVALEAEMPPSAAFASTALFELGVVPHGYLWIFPRGDRLSVGIGIVVSHRLDLRATLRREMLSFGVELKDTPLRAHPLPIHVRAERLHTGRCLLVGDAAGLVDPFSGEGIRHAIRSARLAAASLLEDDLAGYTARLDRQIGRGLRFIGWLSRLFLYRFPRLGFQLGARNPRITQALVDLLDDRADYFAVNRRAIRSVIGSVLTIGERGGR